MIFASRAVEQSLGIFWVVTIGRGRWGAEMGKLLSALRALEGPPQLRMSPPPNTQVLNHPAPNAQVLTGATQHRTKAPPIWGDEGCPG